MPVILDLAKSVPMQDLAVIHFLLKFYLCKYLVWQLGSVKADMGLIKLRKANEAGEDVGVLFVNTHQIVAIIAGENTTGLEMTDGHIRCVEYTPEEVVSFAKTTT